jgi:hypothetical protein
VRCFGNKCGGAESHALGRREESLAGLVGELMQAAEASINSVDLRSHQTGPAEYSGAIGRSMQFSPLSSV